MKCFARVALVVATVAGVALVPAIPRAVAADATAEATARGHFRRAEADYAAGRYAVALEEYQAGYDATPLPGFLVNIAQCQRRLGDLARARATYSKFIMVAPDSPLVPEVKKLIAEVDQLLAEAQAAEKAAPVAGPDDVVPPGAAAPSTAPAPAQENEKPEAKPAVALAAPAPAATEARHVDEPGDGTPEAAPKSHLRWWLLGGAVVAVAVAATAVVLLGSRDPETIHTGSLGTLR